MNVTNPGIRYTAAEYLDAKLLSKKLFAWIKNLSRFATEQTQESKIYLRPVRNLYNLNNYKL